MSGFCLIKLSCQNTVVRGDRPLQNNRKFGQVKSKEGDSSASVTKIFRI